MDMIIYACHHSTWFPCIAECWIALLKGKKAILVSTHACMYMNVPCINAPCRQVIIFSFLPLSRHPLHHLTRRNLPKMVSRLQLILQQHSLIDYLECTTLKRSNGCWLSNIACIKRLWNSAPRSYTRTS